MSIKEKAINSGKWVSISTVIQVVLQFVQMAVLARLLEPEIFGIVAISNVIIFFFRIFGDLGLTNSIIYKQEEDRGRLSTVFYINLLLGLVLYSIVYVITPYVVEFYNEPKVYEVLRLSSLIFLFIYFGSVFSSLLKKELRFKSIAIIDVAGGSIGAIITVYLALQGYEELSLVYGSLIAHFLRVVLEVYFGKSLFRPLLYFNIKDVKEHIIFGVYNFGESFLGYFESNWDSIIIGKLLNSRYLGIYTLAMQLSVYPVSKLNPLILQVAYPILAKVKENNGQLKRMYLKILDIVSYFNYPLLAGLFIIVESIVPLVYGSGWEETFPLIRIFVFVAAFNCLAHPLFTVAYAKGKPKYMFYLNIISLAIKIPLVYYMGMRWQLMGIAYAMLISSIIFSIMNFIIVNYLIGDYFSEFIGNIIKPITFCMIMIFTIYLYKLNVGSLGWLHTLVEIGIGGAIYIGLTFAFKYSLADVREIKRAL